MSKVVDQQIVEKIAKLSKIILNEDEKKLMSIQIGQFLEYVELLGEVPEETEPLDNLTGNKNCWREDKVVGFADTKKIVENCPKNKEGFFLVPKVLE